MDQQAGNNPVIRRNALIFAILTAVTHVLACFMYGFFFKVPSMQTNGQFFPIFTVFAHGLLVVVGFGLLFSYLKRLIWTGMGFTLLITALSIQFYFMINAFWIKADVTNYNLEEKYFSSDDKTYDLYLTNQNAPNLYMATVTGSFRCALAMIVAFSSILGRAGPLEAWFVTVIGTIGYELNRQIINNYVIDSGGTNAIFVFGGFMSLMIGIMRKIKQKDPNNTGQHERYTGSQVSSTLALLGTLFVFIFFPILTQDHLQNAIALHTRYTSVYTVIFSLVGATLASFATSMILNRGLLIRDIIYGPVAGGVISSSAAYYVTNPVYGILMGIVAGLVQVLAMNLVQKKFAREKNIFHSFSFTLFGIQGMLGGVFAAIWHTVSRGQATNGFIFNYDNVEYGQIYSWLVSLISMAMGVGFGLIAGVLCMLVGGHTREDHFTDNTYWQQDDGIRLTEAEIGMRQGEGVKGRFDYL